MKVDKSVKVWVGARSDDEFRSWATSFPEGTALRIIADRYEQMLPPLKPEPYIRCLRCDGYGACCCPDEPGPRWTETV